MKPWLILLCFLTATSLWADPTPTPFPPLQGKWAAATVPWDIWFKKNTMVTDKTAYVHFFWNANDFQSNFEGKDDKNARLADAAVYLVKKLFPAKSKEDLVKVDIGYVLERDTYGLPKWDSLQPVVHIEFSRSKVLTGKTMPDFSVTTPDKTFDAFQIF